MQRYDTLQNNSASNNQFKIFSSIGKQTAQSSHFDFSNGLPDCLRSAQQKPYKNVGAAANDEAETSFNDFQYA